MSAGFTEQDAQTLLSRHYETCAYCGTSKQDIRFSAGCEFCRTPDREDEQSTKAICPENQEERAERQARYERLLDKNHIKIDQKKLQRDIAAIDRLFRERKI